MPGKRSVCAAAGKLNNSISQTMGAMRAIECSLYHALFRALAGYLGT
jgi:hypothetical protein